DDGPQPLEGALVGAPEDLRQDARHGKHVIVRRGPVQVKASRHPRCLRAPVTLCRTRMTDRARARALARAAIDRDRPLDWFEELYREAEAGTAVVPWADLVPNPHLVEWLDQHPPPRGRALDVGCGLGDT